MYPEQGSLPDFRTYSLFYTFQTLKNLKLFPNTLDTLKSNQRLPKRYDTFQNGRGTIRGAWRTLFEVFSIRFLILRLYKCFSMYTTLNISYLA